MRLSQFIQVNGDSFFVTPAKSDGLRSFITQWSPSDASRRDSSLDCHAVHWTVTPSLGGMPSWFFSLELKPEGLRRAEVGGLLPTRLWRATSLAGRQAEPAFSIDVRPVGLRSFIMRWSPSGSLPRPQNLPNFGEATFSV